MSSIRQGIQTFLNNRKAASSFLIDRWSVDLESQFLVHPGSNEVEEGSKCWTDGSETWSNHRWPYQAGSDPKYKDKKLKFSPGSHLSRVGSTWWNWKKKRSVAVAFDIDMEDDGHAATTNTVTEKELEAVVERLSKIPYVTTIRSTGGSGVHVYVFFNERDLPEAANHNEHTQVALATLAKINADGDYDFSQHMDVKGVILWFWADTSDASHAGFTLIHEATESIGAKDIAGFRGKLLDSPNKKRTLKGFDDAGQPAESEGETGGYKVFEVEDSHKIILRELEALDYDFIWNAEFNMAHTNTRALRELHQNREKAGNPLKGMFESTSQGHVKKPNCYITPRPGGSFQVKRFGNGIAEHASWNTKENDTWCYFNQGAPVSNVLDRFGKNQGHKYIFEPAELEGAMQALGHTLGESHKNIQSAITVHRRKDGTFYATCKDTFAIEGWVSNKSGNQRDLPMVEQEEDRQNTLLEDIDDIARYVLTPQKEPFGWALQTNLGWIMLSGYDCVQPKISQMFGKESGYVKSIMIENPWMLTTIPFAQEYPGDRQWNHQPPQLAMPPSEVPGPHPHWDLVYEHLGRSLDEVALNTEWCQKWGLTTGADYLRFWMAAMIQFPFEPLPYLFFYGPQNSGKSMFHESASMLFTHGSVASAGGALTNAGGFNYEIAKCVIGYIEEKDLSLVKDSAYARMKEWITSKTLTITKKSETPYTQRNFLKMMQMANSPTACTMEDGDTRITALMVSILMNIIPKGLMEKRLMAEAPFFLRTLMTTHIPETHDRLRVPMLASRDKQDLEAMNQKPWEEIASEVLYPCMGEMVKFKDFYDVYQSRCMLGNTAAMKPKALLQLLRNRGDKYVVGFGPGKVNYIGNVTMEPKTVSGSPPLQRSEKGRLVKCTG